MRASASIKNIPYDLLTNGSLEKTSANKEGITEDTTLHTVIIALRLKDPALIYSLGLDLHLLLAVWEEEGEEQMDLPEEERIMNIS